MRSSGNYTGKKQIGCHRTRDMRLAPPILRSDDALPIINPLSKSFSMSHLYSLLAETDSKMFQNLTPVQMSGVEFVIRKINDAQVRFVKTYHLWATTGHMLRQVEWHQDIFSSLETVTTFQHQQTQILTVRDYYCKVMESLIESIESDIEGLRSTWLSQNN